MSPTPNKEMLKNDGHITKVQKDKLRVHIPDQEEKTVAEKD